VAVAPPPPKTVSAPPSAEDDAMMAFQVANRHQAQLKQACWESSSKTSTVVNVTASLDSNGGVTSANASAPDAGLAQCVGAQVKTWTFTGGSARTVRFTVRFRR
jgi:hypothetical protein